MLPEINQFKLRPGPYRLHDGIYVVTEILTHDWRDPTQPPVELEKPLVVFRNLEQQFVDKKWVAKTYSMEIDLFKQISTAL